MPPPEMIGARVAGEPRYPKSSRSNSSFATARGANQVHRRADSARPVHPSQAETDPSAARRSNAYGAMLLADGYCEEARQALRNGDDAAARDSLSIIRGLASAALTLISDPSDHRVRQ